MRSAALYRLKLIAQEMIMEILEPMNNLGEQIIKADELEAQGIPCTSRGWNSWR